VPIYLVTQSIIIWYFFLSTPWWRAQVESAKCAIQSSLWVVPGHTPLLTVLHHIILNEISREERWTWPCWKKDNDSDWVWSA
jgi:hypothetical protein